MLCAIAAIVCQIESKGPQGAWLNTDGATVRGIESNLVKVAFRGNRLEWSPDGTCLVLGRQTGASYHIEFWRSGQPTVKVDKDASWPSWSQSGKAAAYSTEDGLYHWDLSAPEPRKLMPTGSNPALSPDGRRIAFAMQGSKQGLWICDPNGRNLRRIVRDFKVFSPAWAWHGRNLAFIATGKEAPKPTLCVANADGKNLTPLGLAETDVLEWAPNSSRILIKRGSRFGICDADSGKSAFLPEQATVRPLWLSPSRLIGLVAGRPAVYEYNGIGFEPAAYDPGVAGQLDAFAPFRGFVMEGKAPDPFARAERPRRGQIRITGWISNADPFDQKFTIQIHTSVASTGIERGYGKPLTQVVSMGAAAVRSTGGKSVPLRPTDLRQDDEVSLIVNGTEIGNLDPIAIDKAYIPSLSGLSGRGLVSSGKTPAGMVFPVTGKVSWSDTFGAARDGGSRRHQGTDIFASQMRPLVAAFDGTVWFSKNQGARSGKHLSLDGDNGWSCAYMHINNDTPGTDDGIGDDRYAFAPGLKPGDHVYAGQIIAYVGDSGNAESTRHHLHFELYGPNGLVNPAPVLKLLRHLDRPLYKNGFDIVPLAKDESQWDGVIKSVDSERKVVAIELSAKRTASKPLSPIFYPNDVYVRFDDGGKLQFAGNENVKVGFGDLRPGLVISAVGTKPSGSSVVSRLMIVDFPSGS